MILRSARRVINNSMAFLSCYLANIYNKGVVMNADHNAFIVIVRMEGWVSRP